MTPHLKPTVSWWCCRVPSCHQMSLVSWILLAIKDKMKVNSKLVQLGCNIILPLGVSIIAINGKGLSSAVRELDVKLINNGIPL